MKFVKKWSFGKIFYKIIKFKIKNKLGKIFFNEAR